MAPSLLQRDSRPLSIHQFAWLFPHYPLELLLGPVGRVHVQHDLCGGLAVAVQELPHQKRVGPPGVGHDALAAFDGGLPGDAQLQPVEGAGGGQLPAEFVAAGGQGSGVRRIGHGAAHWAFV